MHEHTLKVKSLCATAPKLFVDSPNGACFLKGQKYKSTWLPLTSLADQYYLVVITKEASFNPSAAALILIFPGVVSGRIIARHIP